MSRCARPGCPGELEEGYCNVCGMAPAPVELPDAADVADAADAADGYGERAAPPARNAAPYADAGGPYAVAPVPHARISAESQQDPALSQIPAQAPAPAPAQPQAPAGPDASPGGWDEGDRGEDEAEGPDHDGGLSSGVRTAIVTASGLFTATDSGSTRGVLGSTRSSRRGMLGAGLLDMPPVPYRDPSVAVLLDPEVAEKRRFCSNCAQPVGRSRGDRPGRSDGFCRHCGTGFSFTPKLWQGDLVGGQYEVLGCLTHGGLGWIYLARDRNVNNRWVVLKGLLDTGDAAAMLSVAAERAFLAEVEHPNIVKIYNFVQHPDPRTGAMVGYIVMEYVGGRSLKDIVLDYRRGLPAGDEFPLGRVLAYGLEALRALGYLHSKGLLFCDFKPDNAIQSEEQLKLIDLGGVRRMDDTDSPIYGTTGYQAPEVASVGPSIGSDLYTVGRTLAVLSFRFRGFTGRYADSLPPRSEIPVLNRYESYDRLLRRATHEDPAARFTDAEEMASQLTGVLREVLAAEDGQERPAPSALFGTERHVAGAELAEPDTARRATGHAVFRGLDPVAAAAALPVPGDHSADPATEPSDAELDDLVTALGTIQTPSAEDRLLEIRVRVARGEVARADELLAEVNDRKRLGWWTEWYRALVALAAGRFDAAAERFDMLYGLMPGEAAPKLALAFIAECRGVQDHAAGRTDEAARQRTVAAHYYELVRRTDRSYLGAAFGLARVRLAGGDRRGATEVLDTVPKTSSHHVDAQVAAVAVAVRGRGPAQLGEADLVTAGTRLQNLGLDTKRHGRLAAELLEAALAWKRFNGGRAARHADRSAPADGTRLLGGGMAEKELRRGLERTYRELARHADTADDRHTLVARANAVRPKTLL